MKQKLWYVANCNRSFTKKKDAFAQLKALYARAREVEKRDKDKPIEEGVRIKVKGRPTNFSITYSYYESYAEDWCERLHRTELVRKETLDFFVDHFTETIDEPINIERMLQ